MEDGLFISYLVEKNSELREFVKTQRENQVYKQGCAYYEFQNERENVTEDKELILMHKVILTV